MNILVVQESDWIKRNPHQQHHLLERLSLRGHKIRVIDYDIDWKTNNNDQIVSKRQIFKNTHKIHEDANIEVIRPGIIKIPVINYFSLLYSHGNEIQKQIKEFKPDVIIGFGLLNTYLASRAAKKNGIPFVYYLIDVLYTLIPEKTFQYIGKKVKQRIIDNSSLVLTINQRLAEFAVNLGSDEEKTMVIDAGIDLKRFDPGIDGSVIRKEYGINDDELVLFFMGWIYHFAGVKEVAIKLGKDNYKNIKLMVVGDGDAYHDLEEIRDKYKMDHQLILTGKQPYDKIPEFISAADVCILPAYPDEIIMQDIVPIKIYEYMAMEKPVITTNLPGIKAEFGEKNGVLYVDQPEGVIPRSLEQDIKDYGEIARKFVGNNDWESITDKFEKTLVEVVRIG
jgi:glycosyltransferase involved in cell wall biosynthesis